MSPQIKGTKVESESNLRPVLHEGKGLAVLEISTLFVLVSIAFICMWPLLEEWDLFHAFKAQGLAYVWTAIAHTVRPLHLVPYAMQWVLGGERHLTGVATATALLLVLRYLAARWAVSPFLGGYGRWTVSTMAAALVPWDGVWLGRYVSAQFAAVFFFLALGAVFRLFQRWSMRWAVVCALCVLVLLATYQGLFLCLAVLPLALPLWHDKDQIERTEAVSTVLRMAAIYIVIGAGGVIYGLYWFAISHLFGSGLYEEGLASGANGIGVLAHIKAMYVTAYLREPMELPLLAAIVCLVCWRGLEGVKASSLHGRLICLMALYLMLLPLFGLIYVNQLHLHDPERINYPVSAGLVVLVACLLICFSRRQVGTVDRLTSSAVVLIVLINCGFTATGIRENAVLQKSVLRQARGLVREYRPESLIIRDETGTLGDVYTLYQTAMGDALAIMGQENVNATICTPLSVDRLHPVANRFPIPSTPRCEDLPELKQAPPSGVLVTQWNNGILKPETGK